MVNKFDYVIIGSGVGGLFTGALLASSGYSVCILEKHSKIGGYGHSFYYKGYTFCAELHYLCNCGFNEDGGRFFRKVGLIDEIEFIPLNPAGYDRFFFPSFNYNIVKGFDHNVELISREFPIHRSNLKKYYGLLTNIYDELFSLPIDFSLTKIISRPFAYINLIKYRNYVTSEVFNKFCFPLKIQSILSGQSGNLLLPPSMASFLVHACMVVGYDRGACVPKKSYEYMFNLVADYLKRKSRCEIQLSTNVVRLIQKKGKIKTAISEDGKEFHADKVIFNGDPKAILNLIDHSLFPKKYLRKFDYDYSRSCMTLYIGLKNINLADYGFGNWNVWHYSHDDVNEVFRMALQNGSSSMPALFISTPSLHLKSENVAPLGCQQMVICTPCNYSFFKKLKMSSPHKYKKEKEKFKERILDIIEDKYIPNFRKHIDVILTGTPVTNEFFVNAPEGNAYGANLTPKNFNFGKVNYRTPINNLFFIGATVGIPSFAGGIHFSIKLVEKLTGEKIS